MNFNNLPPGAVVHVGGFVVMHEAHYVTLNKIVQAHFDAGSVLARLTADIMRLRAEHAEHAVNLSASAIGDTPAAVGTREEILAAQDRAAGFNRMERDLAGDPKGDKL